MTNLALDLRTEAMHLELTHPHHALLLPQLLARQPNAPALASPNSVPGAYLSQGSHPDIVARVWEGLASALPRDGRALVYGNPVLLQADSGLLLALAYGTQYLIWIPEVHRETALAAGCKTVQTWAGGASTESEQIFGRGWLFGAWCKDEAQWVRAAYDELS